MNDHDIEDNDDGSMPEILEDFQELLSIEMENLATVGERLRSLGYSGVFIVTGYDPLADFSHCQWRMFGHDQAVVGAVSTFEKTVEI